jgi:hypothetical protein
MTTLLDLPWEVLVEGIVLRGSLQGGSEWESRSLYGTCFQSLSVL